eukprot:6518634-Lingulodinium_polyedra.AAC.1
MVQASPRFSPQATASEQWWGLPKSQSSNCVQSLCPCQLTGPRRPAAARPAARSQPSVASASAALL